MLGKQSFVFLVQIKTATGQYLFAVLIDQMIQVYRFGKSTQGKIEKLSTNGLLHMNSKDILPGLESRSRRLSDIFSLVVSGVSSAVQNLPAIEKYGNILIVVDTPLTTRLKMSPSRRLLLSKPGRMFSRSM